MKQHSTSLVVTLGLLTALQVVLSRFCSINAWNIKIGFSFVPVVAAAVLYGPLPAGVVAALGDFLGATLFPIGPYFPGFTLTAFCTGCVFGVLLRRRQTAARIAAAVLIQQLFLSLLVDSLWISILYQSPYVPLLHARILQCAILGPVQFAGSGLVVRALNRRGKKALA